MVLRLRILLGVLDSQDVVLGEIDIDGHIASDHVLLCGVCTSLFICGWVYCSVCCGLDAVWGYIF